MSDLDLSLDAFIRDLHDRHLASSVLIATISEFGRRVPDNGSSGLDHGGASTALLIGPVRSGVYGELPRLDKLDNDDNLVATVTMTDYYATIAEQWFGIPANTVLSGRPLPIAGILR
jgi:uncharacterized protein (DUF1501 family)